MIVSSLGDRLWSGTQMAAHLPLLNRIFANDMENSANDTAPSYVFPELRRLAADKKTWAVLAGVVVLLALAGPFSTYSTLSLAERGVYWAVSATTSFWIGFACSLIVACKAEEMGLTSWLALVLGGIAAGIPIAFLYALLDQVLFGDSISASFLALIPYTSAVAVIVAVLYELLAAGREPAIGETSQPQALPHGALMDKLPAGLGRDIVHLQSQDHYVKIRTVKGSALVLASMNEAEIELARYGLRVHRSWWVARRHIAGLTYRRGALYLITSIGDQIPVGRKYRAGVRQAVS